MAQSKIIYGIHAVMAALEHHPEHILNLYCFEREDVRFYALAAKAKQQDVALQFRTRVQLDKVANSPHHQGVVAMVRVPKSLDEQAIYAWLEAPPSVPLMLILEGVQDPHNLGACLRSAEALGVDWVVVPKMNAAPINATVSKVSCGADQVLPLVEISNVVRFIEQIKKRGIWVVGTAIDADLTLAQADFTRPSAIVMGTEGKGLKRLTLEACDETVRIPMLGTLSSLNVSVATGIALYECLRQRRGERI